MLTPNDIANKKFEKGMGGYKVHDVEAFMSQVSDTVIDLLKEKAELEQKLELLADKLQEYRQDEDSLRTALLGAQKLGDGVIRESKTKAEIIMRDATIKAERMIDNAQAQIEKEKANLAKMQSEVSTFKSRLLALYKQHLSLITALPEVEGKIEEEPAEDDTKFAKTFKQAAAPAPAEEEPIRQKPAVQQHEENYDNEDEEAEQATTYKKPEGKLVFMTKHDSEEDEEPFEEPKQESRFGPLKFGTGYELTRDEQSAPKKKR